jgi:phage baseplate assembly protein W
MNQKLLGTDVVIGKNVTLVTGFENLGLQLIRRLSTPRGALFYDPNYGDDIRLFLNKPITPSTIKQIEYVVKTQCEQDPRVDNADVSVTYNQSLLALVVTISITTFLGPFTLVISVSSLTIDMLTISSA